MDPKWSDMALYSPHFFCYVRCVQYKIWCARTEYSVTSTEGGSCTSRLITSVALDASTPILHIAQTCLLKIFKIFKV